MKENTSNSSGNDQRNLSSKGEQKERHNPFKNADQKNVKQESAEEKKEEAEAEQQWKEALTERD